LKIIQWRNIIRHARARVLVVEEREWRWFACAWAFPCVRAYVHRWCVCACACAWGDHWL